ncbi:uncharacterized protein LOC144365366 [Ictidomys tridecemlineatus]
MKAGFLSFLSTKCRDMSSDHGTRLGKAALELKNPARGKLICLHWNFQRLPKDRPGPESCILSHTSAGRSRSWVPHRGWLCGQEAPAPTALPCSLRLAPTGPGIGYTAAVVQLRSCSAQYDFLGCSR